MSQDPDQEEHERLGFRKIEWDELDALASRIEAMLDQVVPEGGEYRRVRVEQMNPEDVGKLLQDVDGFLKRLRGQG